MHTNREIQQEAANILSDKEFQSALPTEDKTSWIQKAIDELLSKIKFDTPESNIEFDGLENFFIWMYHYGGAIVTWGAVLVILLIVVFIVYKLVTRKRLHEDTLVITPQQRLQAHQSHTDIAKAAFDAGDFNKAIHHLFLATVSLVIRDDYFYASAMMTNREIAGATDFSQMALDTPIQTLFHQMVSFDEPRWFGTKTASQEDYQHFFELYQSFQQQVRAYVG